jgi:excisionase family DNA binding protein
MAESLSTAPNRVPERSKEQLAPRLVSLREAARALDVSDRYLRILEQRGKLRFVRMGRLAKVHVDDVDRLAREGVS